MFKTAVGYFFLQLSIIGLVTNLGVLFPLLRIMKKGDKQCVYLIAIVTMLNDTINLLINCCYFAPTIIANSYIFGDAPTSLGPMIMVNIAHSSWYNEIFITILMAFNRLVVLVFNKTDMFTKTRVIAFFLISAILSCGKILIDIFVFPCCLVLMDYEKFGFDVPNPQNQTDWSDWIDTPIEVSVFAITVVSYIIIFIKIRISTTNSDQSIDSKQKKMKAREESIAVQFASVSIFSMLSYASLKLTPIIFGDDHVESNIISPIFYAMNGCANSFVFIFMNDEVNDDIMKRIFKNNSVHSTGEDGNPNIVPFEQPEFMI